MKLMEMSPGRDVVTLYQLLSERTPEQSISHKSMPTFEQHLKFVRSRPYKHWYMIYDGEDVVGATYLTKQMEIGIAVFKSCRRQGHARAAIHMLMGKHPGPYLANINPKNEASIALFDSLGFNLLQVTYARD